LKSAEVKWTNERILDIGEEALEKKKEDVTGGTGGVKVEDKNGVLKEKKPRHKRVPRKEKTLLKKRKGFLKNSKTGSLEEKRGRKRCLINGLPVYWSTSGGKND